MKNLLHWLSMMMMLPFEMIAMVGGWAPQYLTLSVMLEVTILVLVRKTCKPEVDEFFSSRQFFTKVYLSDCNFGST